MDRYQDQMGQTEFAQWMRALNELFAKAGREGASRLGPELGAFAAQGQRMSPAQPQDMGGQTAAQRLGGWTQGLPADLPAFLAHLQQEMNRPRGQGMPAAPITPGATGGGGGEGPMRPAPGAGPGAPNFGLPGTAAYPNDPIDPEFARNLGGAPNDPGFAMKFPNGMGSPTPTPGSIGGGGGEGPMRVGGPISPPSAGGGGGGGGYGASLDAHDRGAGGSRAPMGFGGTAPSGIGGGGGGGQPGGGGMGGGAAGPMGGGASHPDFGRTPFMRTYYDKMGMAGQGEDVLDSMYRDRGLNRPDRDPIAQLNKDLYGKSLGLIAAGMQTADQETMPDTYETGNRLTGAMGRMGGGSDLNAYRQQIREGFTPGGDEALDNLYAGQSDQALLELMLASEMMGGSLPGLAKSRADLANQDMIRAQRAYLEANQGGEGKMSDFDRMSIYRNRMSR